MKVRNEPVFLIFHPGFKADLLIGHGWQARAVAIGNRRNIGGSHGGIVEVARTGWQLARGGIGGAGLIIV